MLAMGYPLTLGPSAPKPKKKQKKETLKKFYFIVLGKNNEKNVNSTLNTSHLWVIHFSSVFLGIPKEAMM